MTKRRFGKKAGRRGDRIHSRKNKVFRNHSRRKSHDDFEQAALKMLADELIGVLYKAGTMSLSELMEKIGESGDGQKVERVLFDLCHKRILTCKPHDTYRLRGSADYLEGEIFINPRGFGFVTVENPSKKLRIDKDVFIPPSSLGTAVHGDRVLIKISGQKKGRFEGTVIRVLQRGTTKIVGIYSDGRTSGLVIPEDDRLPFSVEVANEFSSDARNGDAVVVKVIDYRGDGRNPSGEIIEILGDPADLQVQTDITIRNFDLPHEFSEQVAQEVEKYSSEIKLEPQRRDLREILHVTIDGEDARDFDDAVAIEKTRSGFRLYVSIADVSHYVKPGTSLDKEAYERGTSVYFPNRVVPMLPERLSNNLCSLVPKENRYAFTAILDFDESGKRTGKTFCKSVIKSMHRLTYTKVFKMLVEQDQELRKEYADIQKVLVWMGALAEKLEDRRMQRGSIGFELPEAQIELGPDNTVTAVRRRERNAAHKLIEEFMLAANEAVAETFTKENMPALYRVHEAPDPEHIEEFSSFAKTMGLILPKGNGSPAWFGKVLKSVVGKPQEYIVNNLLLRSMKQACYAEKNVGHFGLAAQNYTHFTSPIRRYPDLMVHRALENLLSASEQQEKPSKGARPLAEAGEFLSKRERLAIDAEREMMDRLKVRFMEKKIGETYEGIISGVSSFGLFVELLDFFISGAIPLTELTDDYYEIDEKNHRLIGRVTNKVYQMGNVISVRVYSVDVRRRRVNFVVAE